VTRIEPGLGGQVAVRHSNEVYVDSNGRKRVGVHMTCSPEVIEQFRTGYRCIACKVGVQSEPFPERCVEPWCRFPMRRDQSARFAWEYRGEETLWPDREAADVERETWEARNGFWLPNQ
jgi:hypothetical protein